MDWLEWSPETLRLEIKDDFNVEVTDDGIDKIMAVIAVLTTDSFYRDLPRFIELCNVFADAEFNPMVFDPADAWEIAWAITEVSLLDPPEDPEHAFSDEIRRYIGKMVQEAGFVNPPDVLRLAIIDEHNPDPVADFSDDPTMYSAFWKNQSSRSDEVRSMLRQQLTELLEQLSDLPLKEGNTQGLLEKLKKERQEA